MDVPTELPYCLMYPIVYNEKAVNKTHFTTLSSPSGLCTGACVCHTLLLHMNDYPAKRQGFKGAHMLVPHGTQYKMLFPVMAKLHNHCSLLMDPKTGEPYPLPMENVGNFSLKDDIFPGPPGDSLLFHNSEIGDLVRQGFHVPAHREETPEASNSMKHKSPHVKEAPRSPPIKMRNPVHPAVRPQGCQFPTLLAPASPCIS